MKVEYIEMLKDLDSVLAERRKLWVEARQEDRAKCMANINELLDKRLKLMKARDAAHELNA